MALIGRTLAGVLAIVACAPEPEPFTPDIEWEGKWLRFGRSPARAPQCAGVAPYMDRYVGALVDLFEIESEVLVDFYFVDKDEMPCKAIGCVIQHSAWSQVPLQEHELVHLVRSFAEFSHLFLEEGAAEYWGDDSTGPAFDFREETEGSIVEAAETASQLGLETWAYGVAGRFHSFLVREMGTTTTNALLRSTTDRMDAEALNENLVAATGLNLAEWETAFAEYPVCDQAEFRDASIACSSVPLVPRCLDGETTTLEIHVGCDDEHTLGPRDGEIWTYRTIELDVTGTYSFSVGPDLEMKGGSVELKQCSAAAALFWNSKKFRWE